MFMLLNSLFETTKQNLKIFFLGISLYTYLFEEMFRDEKLIGQFACMIISHICGMMCHAVWDWRKFWKLFKLQKLVLKSLSIYLCATFAVGPIWVVTILTKYSYKKIHLLHKVDPSSSTRLRSKKSKWLFLPIPAANHSPAVNCMELSIL